MKTSVISANEFSANFSENCYLFLLFDSLINTFFFIMRGRVQHCAASDWTKINSAKAINAEVDLIRLLILLSDCPLYEHFMLLDYFESVVFRSCSFGGTSG